MSLHTSVEFVVENAFNVVIKFMEFSSLLPSSAVVKHYVRINGKLSNNSRVKASSLFLTMLLNLLGI